MDPMYEAKQAKPDSQFYKWLKEQKGDPGFVGQIARHLCGTKNKYHAETLKKLPDTEEAWISQLSKSRLMTREQVGFYITNAFSEYNKEKTHGRI